MWCCPGYVVLSGRVAVAEAVGTPEQRVARLHGPGRFLGDLGMLTGQPAYATSIVADPGEVIAIPSDRLRDAGVGVAIDDYGTGYSSLAYLAELPVTELKLDRAFVSAMTGSPRSAAIVTSTLQLAHALGLVLVAEGAEDQGTVDALSELGCDVLQGYHLSRPLPPERLLPWLHARARVVPVQQSRRPAEIAG